MGVEQYRALFATESEEHLQIISNAVLNLEKDPHNTEILNEIFRSAHTLKGMSATMGFESLTKLTHKMEDVLDVFRSQKRSVTGDVVDILFRCLDMLQMLLEEVKTQKNLNLDISALLVELESVIPAINSAAKQTVAESDKEICLTAMEKQNLSVVSRDQDVKLYTLKVYLSPDCQLKSVRVFMIFAKLDEMGEIVKAVPSVEDLEMSRFDRLFSVLFLSKVPKKKIEEVLKKIMEVDRVDVGIIKDVAQIPEEKEPESSASAPDAVQAAKAVPGRDLIQQMGFKKIQSIRVSTQRLDKLMNFVGELVISKIRLMQIAQTHQLQPLNEILTNIDRLTSDLQDEVMQARLIPMSQVFDRFPRMVRDLAHTEKKQINFEVTGGEIELDRTVLDEIADPLVHLLRNSIDHGIELPEERKNAGKNPAGTVRLGARRERTYVLIEVSDDGKGIDPNLMRVLAVKKGFMTEEDASKLSDKEAIGIITLAGFSSAETITDTSGRGVGMDVVKMKIESLGGTLSFESELGKGSRFHLKLP
ncbi:MAG: chemotaxis protein CheA, partial [Candidatus Omnitrophica bacterium]|nr:chemotaxis protein CheA [Candidatus Omnitrophota bacterium]